MGTAFYLRDNAIKRGDPRVIGTLAHATPVLPTALPALSTGRAVSAARGEATRLVARAAVLALRAGAARCVTPRRIPLP